MSTSIRRAFAAAALVCLTSSPVRGQGTPAMGAAARGAVIDSAIHLLASTYVDADTGRLIGDVLRRHAADGTYASLGDPAAFAQAVTRDLQSVNGDLHLSLRFVPAPADAGGGGRRQAPRGLVADASQNYGLVKADVLPGNIGYLEISSFGTGDFREAVGDAMKFLSRTDAMIIDVRRNGGGDGNMSHLVFSHFLPPNTPTIVVRRRGARADTRHTVADVPGPRRTDVPLFVLTSRSTGSAAEEFSFVLKNRHRATIVGSRTAGAGHMVTFVPAGEGFVLGLSITRVSDPVTGKEWERVGVLPDLDVAPGDALLTAEDAALHAMLAAHPDPDRVLVLNRVLEGVDAQLHPRSAPAAELRRFTGTYAGRVVSESNGTLRYQRAEGGQPEDLTWLGDNRFALGPVRYEFAQHDGTMWLTIETPEGARVTFPRSS